MAGVFAADAAAVANAREEAKAKLQDFVKEASFRAREHAWLVLVS